MKDSWKMVCVTRWFRTEVNSQTGEIRYVQFDHFKDKDGVWHRLETYPDESLQKIKLEGESVPVSDRRRA